MRLRIKGCLDGIAVAVCDEVNFDAVINDACKIRRRNGGDGRRGHASLTNGVPSSACAVRKNVESPVVASSIAIMRGEKRIMKRSFHPPRTVHEPTARRNASRQQILIHYLWKGIFAHSEFSAHVLCKFSFNLESILYSATFYLLSVRAFVSNMVVLWRERRGVVSYGPQTGASGKLRAHHSGPPEATRLLCKWGRIG
ncbi:hypothetical protein EDC31_1821 [Acidomonas methanolica]|nr:hypothetical protein EDC31_1821 [Acidomonas methanolica]